MAASNELISKILSSNSENNGFQKQLSSLTSPGNEDIKKNGTVNAELVMKIITEIFNTLTKTLGEFFSSHAVIFLFILICVGFLFLCSFFFMLYFCCRTKWCLKFKKNEQNKFKLFD